MLSIIENNPYRILGSYSDSKLIDIIANANKIKAFAKVGRTVPFETDNIPGFTTLPVRTVESVDAALALIQSDADKSKYSIFWFNKSGIDFGTADLISGNMRSAGSKFITAIESNDIAFIQDVIGDKAKSISSSDLLNCYIDVMSEYGHSENAILGCLDASTFEQHISIISALQKNGLSEELKTKAESISEVSIENPSSAFTSLKRIINEIKQLIVGKNISGDIALSGAYDQICKAVRSKVISISNKAFDNIGKTEKSDFIAILKSCLDILKSIDTSFASAGTVAKFKEDIESFSKNIKDVDEAYLIAIASNEEICWYCGEKATHTVTKNYEKKEEKHVGYNRKQVTTYTKSVKLHVCDECQKENDTAGKWALFGAVIMVVIECIVSIIFTCNNSYYGFEWSWDWLWPVIIGNIFLFWVTFFIGALIGTGLRWIYNKSTGTESRKFIREDNDHPLIKKIKNQGFS